MTARLRITAIAATAVAAPALLLAGCGGGDSATTTASATTAATTAAAGTSSTGASNVTTPASVLLDQARAAVTAATSVHIVGTAAAASSGEAQALDLTAGRDGNGEGTIHFSPGDIDVRVVNGTPYAKAPAGFWAASGATAAQAKALGGVWVTAPASGSDAAQMTGFADMVDMAKVVDPILAGFGTPTRAIGPTLGGVPTVTLTDPTGNRLWLPRTGAPLPLRYHANATGRQGTVRYSAWSAPVTVSAPAGAVDFGQLGG